MKFLSNQKYIFNFKRKYLLIFTGYDFLVSKIHSAAKSLTFANVEGCYVK